MKIFVLGNNCSGEDQILKFFRNNDIKTKSGVGNTLAWDMHLNKYNNKKPLDGYEDYEAYIMMETLDPFPYYAARDMFKDLDRIYPNSIFIYNYVNEDEWLERRKLYLDGLYMEKYKEFYKASEQNVSQIWDRQNRLFQQALFLHFSENKKRQLLVANLNDTKHFVERLSEYVELVDKSFPQMNTNEST